MSLKRSAAIAPRHGIDGIDCQAAWTTLRLEPATRMCSTRYPTLFSRLEGHSRASRSFSFPRLHAVTAPGLQWGAACAWHSSRNSRCEVRPLEDRAGRDIPRESAACSACAQHRVLRTKLRASLLRPQPRPSDARGGICDFGGYAPITASHCVGEMPVDGRKGMRVLSLTTSPA